MANSEQVRLWIDLPQDIVRLIGNLLKTSQIDVLNFRAVCPSWRSSVPPFPRPPPLTLPLPQPPLNSIEAGYYFAGSICIIESTLYLLQPNPSPVGTSSSSSGGFLIKVVAEEGVKINRLLSPLGHSNQIFPKQINLWDFRVSEICKFHLVGNYNFQVDFNQDTSRKYPSFDRIRILYSKSALVDDSYSVLAGYGDHEGGRGGYLLKPGSEKWTMLHEPSRCSDFPYRNCITYKGRFCVVLPDGSALAFDSSANIFSQIASPVEDHDGVRRGICRMNLVESLGDLLLFRRQFFIPRRSRSLLIGSRKLFITFYVYKLVEEEGKWVEIKTLGDRMLFVDQRDVCSFSISARDFTRCQANCIYEVNFLPTTYDDDFASFTRVYNLDDGSIKEFHGNVLWSRKGMHLAESSSINQCPSCPMKIV